MALSDQDRARLFEKSRAKIENADALAKAISDDFVDRFKRDGSGNAHAAALGAMEVMLARALSLLTMKEREFVAWLSSEAGKE